MNNSLNKLSHLIIEYNVKKLLVRSTSVGSYLIIFSLINRVDPDQAADLGLLCLQRRQKAPL